MLRLLVIGGFALSMGVAGLGCAGSRGAAAGAVSQEESLQSAEGIRNPRAGAELALPHVRRLGKRGWVEVAAQVLGTDSEAPAAARARALGVARQAAVEFVAGVQVRSGQISYQQLRDSDASSLVQTLTASRADALVVDEQIVSSRMVPLEAGGYRVSVVMRARVLDRGDASDRGFRAQLDLGRERFLDGEEVELRVRSTRDARLYVLGITGDGAALLLPNRYLPEAHVRAGEWLRFPGDELRSRGVRLMAQVPAGEDSATEALLVVALRGDRSLDGLLPLGGQVFRAADSDDAGQLLADLLSPLMELRADEWSFDQVVYEVLKR